LADKDGYILAGNARHLAAASLGLTEVPVIFLDDLTEIEAKAYMLADNKLTDRSTWDEPSACANSSCHSLYWQTDY